jgi:glycolate oxidase FAD binding subunit
VTDDAATIGGAIATNDSGPLRHRHGTPRDLLIGVHLAIPDGRIVKAGGTVVKNVAGYDLGKLMSGSCGTLAAIVTATFKLAPVPAVSATVVAGFSTAAGVALAADAIGSSQLEPAAFEVRAPSPFQLLIQFASTQEAVDAQVEAARRLMTADSVGVMDGAAERELWRRHARGVWEAPGVVVRASWLPASLEAVLTLVGELSEQTKAEVELVGRAGVGAGVLRIDGEPEALVASVAHLRARSDLVGHVVVLRADADIKRTVDVWGPASDAAPLMASVKRAFDPAGILNAGRGPV